MRSNSLFALPVLAFVLAVAGDGRAAPPAKPAPAKSATSSGKAASSKATSGNGGSARKGERTEKTDNGVRRMVAGGPTYDDTAIGADTPELRALYAAERELFPPASPLVGSPWPQEVPFPVAAGEDRPRVHASGLPVAPPASAPISPDTSKDMSWLAKLDLPDIPVRWDPRVVKYLEFFKDDPRGRATLTLWLRRSGRYRDSIRKTLRRKNMPEDLTWLAMIESGFDPTARSPVGAMGLWQFMPETGKIYGLTIDRWADLRMSLTSSTEAACDFLGDLYRRFGSWDLAMASYNMGYGGVLSAVRRYNTNDYWALSKLEGSLPWETTLYVPKIIAAAIVSKNLTTFGFQDVTPDAALDSEDVPVAPGTSLASVAQACGATTKEVEQLNPELRASRTPPIQEDWQVKVPAGKASGCTQNLAKARREQAPTERYVVRFGESLEQIAQARRVTVSKLVELNAIAPGEVVRGGTTLVVPRVDGTEKAPDPKDPKKPDGKPVVVVPQDVFVYPDKKRVFYRVQVGDTLRDVCNAFKVSPDEVRRWNDVDPSARLVEAMTLQLYVPVETDLSHAVVMTDKDVRLIVAGTEDFFKYWDDKGRSRIIVTAKSGETIDVIGKRHGVTPAMMERINRRGRNESLSEGERVVVWTQPQGTSKTPSTAAATAQNDATPTLQQPTLGRPSLEPVPTPAMTAPPAPDQLPSLP